MIFARLFRDDSGLVLSEYLGLLGGMVAAGVAGVVLLSGGLGHVSGTALGNAEGETAGYLSQAGGPMLTPMPAVGLPASAGTGSGTTGGGKAGGPGGGNTGNGSTGGGSAGGESAGGSNGTTTPVTYTLSSTGKTGQGSSTVYTGVYVADGLPSVTLICGRNPCDRTTQITP